MNSPPTTRYHPTGSANREPLSPAAVSALSSLGKADPEALAGDEHIALLLLLSEDLMEMERMRNWMQRRLVSLGDGKCGRQRLHGPGGAGDHFG